MSVDYEKLNKDVPELIPGDVVKAKPTPRLYGDSVNYWLVVEEDKLYGLNAIDERTVAICDRWNAPMLIHQREVLKVCRQNGGYTHRELAMIVNDEFVPTIYSKTDVKELTVDEVSELLGYKVKIVGEKK